MRIWNLKEEVTVSIGDSAVKKHRLGCLSDVPTCSFPAVWEAAGASFGFSEPVSLSRNKVKKNTAYIEDF